MKKAEGKTSKGKKLEFVVNSFGWFNCQNEDLIELEIPEGIKWVSCKDNKLTEGCEGVYCQDNQIKTLKLPNSMEWVRCDLGVINLNDYKGKNVKFRFMIK
jgi:hypothetical protein